MLGLNSTNYELLLTYQHTIDNSLSPKDLFSLYFRTNNMDLIMSLCHVSHHHQYVTCVNNLMYSKICLPLMNFKLHYNEN